MIACRRCPAPARVRQRRLCRSCYNWLWLHGRLDEYPAVELQPPTLPAGVSRAAILARRAVVRTLWHDGFSQAAISRATGLSTFAVWRYINTECGR
jgi:hypothetical protein